MLKRKFLSAAVIFVIFFTTRVFAGTAQTNDITYKGTKFGVSEKVFYEQHQNEGFVCSDAPPTSVGRWCSSEVTTYGNLKAQTTAQFLDDRLVLVSIFFRDPPDIASEATIDKNIVSQLEHHYGSPDEIKWPIEAENGGKIWKKVWHKKNGSSVTYLHYLSIVNGSKFETRSVFLQSKDADKLPTRSDNAHKTDM
ncbi:hypothetical protein [Paraburkholderia elongata]|uniref:Secreted protein n=1 Tax=Paraburkholderia elongata TaxID=2675747 RepID=A0A972NRV8_9BURK|nr:hypothetical protein [Paraburkholderia elongata]NPT58676.1 hypothetical protein [Paraburkholderia elongata]